MGGTVALFRRLQVHILNDASLLEWGPTSEDEQDNAKARPLALRNVEGRMDADLRRVSQLRLPAGSGWTWRFYIQAECEDGLLVEVDVELRPFKFVPVRDLLAAGLVLRARTNALSPAQQQEAWDLAERLVGARIDLPPGSNEKGWSVPQAVRAPPVRHTPTHAGLRAPALNGTSKVAPLVPLQGIRLFCGTRTWQTVGPEAETETNRALPNWYTMWRGEFHAELTLSDNRIVRVPAGPFYEIPGRPMQGIRELAAERLSHRSRDRTLTESHQFLLQHLANLLLGRPSALRSVDQTPAHWFGREESTLACWCGVNLPPRWAFLAGYKVVVPALHKPGPTGVLGLRGACKIVEDVYADLDRVASWAVEDSAPIASVSLNEDEWWGRLLLGLDAAPAGGDGT